MGEQYLGGKPKQTISKSVTEYIGINVISVIIGALVFLTASAWIVYIELLTREVYSDYERECDIMKRKSWRKLYSATVITIITIILIIIFYGWERKRFKFCN